MYLNNEDGLSVGKDGSSFTVCALNVGEDILCRTFPTVKHRSLESFSVKSVL